MSRILHENIQIDLARISYASQYERYNYFIQIFVQWKHIKHITVENGQTCQGCYQAFNFFYNFLILIDKTGFVRFYSNQFNAIQQLGKYNLSDRKKTI